MGLILNLITRYRIPWKLFFNKVLRSFALYYDKLQLKLQQAILKLPEKQRIVFNLRYFDEMPYEEMSMVLETSQGALKASYHHAAKKIEDFMINR